MSGSTLSAYNVGALIFFKWGSAGQDHPSIAHFPAGLVDTVTRFVSSHRLVLVFVSVCSPLVRLAPSTVVESSHVLLFLTVYSVSIDISSKASL